MKSGIIEATTDCLTIDDSIVKQPNQLAGQISTQSLIDSAGVRQWQAQCNSTLGPIINTLIILFYNQK